MENKEILEAIAALTSTVNQNFHAMQATLSGIEKRLSQQEAKTETMSERQRLQEQDIEKLKKIVLDLAENKPIKRRGDGVAISKEEAYRQFAGEGFGKVAATRALCGAGILAIDSQHRHTITIRTGGKLIRVLLVIQENNN